MKKKIFELLIKNYDYYSIVKKKSDKIAEKVYHKHDEIFKARLYNLTLNICNQFIYDYKYNFSKRDLFFLADNNININKLLEEFKVDILKMRKLEG